MELFTRLGDLVRSLQADPATSDHPIKRQFLCDGEFLTANLAIVEEAGNALHTQHHHDEVVVVLDGEVDFRVGDTIRRVQPGDLVFIARNTVHGPDACRRRAAGGAVGVRASLRPRQAGQLRLGA
jgi:mannose-6-phosphate isomerase-like protein (cupin superfamily)